jgi:hypothetical protein
MEPQDSLSCAQQSKTGLYSQSYELTPQPPTVPQNPFNIILSPTSSFSSSLLPQDLSIQALYYSIIVLFYFSFPSVDSDNDQNYRYKNTFISTEKLGYMLACWIEA